MKVTLVVLVATCIIVGSIVSLTKQLDMQARITQLECALAQAHAENDTLQAALARAEE